MSPMFLASRIVKIKQVVAHKRALIVFSHLLNKFQYGYFSTPRFTFSLASHCSNGSSGGRYDLYEARVGPGVQRKSEGSRISRGNSQAVGQVGGNLSSIPVGIGTL